MNRRRPSQNAYRLLPNSASNTKKDRRHIIELYDADDNLMAFNVALEGKHDELMEQAIRWCKLFNWRLVEL